MLQDRNTTWTVHLIYELDASFLCYSADSDVFCAFNPSVILFFSFVILSSQLYLKDFSVVTDHSRGY